jgi:hypothetical protein
MNIQKHLKIASTETSTSNNITRSRFFMNGNYYNKCELHSERTLIKQLEYLKVRHNIEFENGKTSCPRQARIDKTPSMGYDTNPRGVINFGCFGCGFNQDIFGLIRELVGCDFRTALDIFGDFVTGKDERRGWYLTGRTVYKTVE